VDHCLQPEEPGPPPLERLNLRRSRDQDAGAAVRENATDLLGSGVRVDDDEGASGLERTEQRDDRIDRVVEAEHDAIAVFRTRIVEDARKAIGCCVNLAVRPPTARADDRGVLRNTSRRLRQQILNPH
jgi:hypothetical protein